jgi:predicted kinase
MKPTMLDRTFFSRARSRPADSWRFTKPNRNAASHLIVDAVYLDRCDRERIEQVAADAGVPFRGLWLTAPAATLRDRVRGRRHDASDATESVLEAQLEVDPGSMSWQTLDAGPASDAIAASARRVLSP